MSAQAEFYRARAEDAHAAAEAATLDNVRDRCLRSAAAWEAMADRATRGDKMRAKLEAEKRALNASVPMPEAPVPQAVAAE